MSSRFLRRLGAVATVAIVGALLTPATASADAPTDPTYPEVVVDVCQGTASHGDGYTTAVDLPTTFTFAANSAQAKAYWEGKAVPLYYNQGTIGGTTIIQGGASWGGVPLCMVIKTSNTTPDGSPESAWRFCTDENLGSCPNLPASHLGSNPKFDSESDAQYAITYLLTHALKGDQPSGISPAWGQQTTKSRALLQIQVWCISDEVSNSYKPGNTATKALNYFNGVPEMTNGWITEDEAKCAQWKTNGWADLARAEAEGLKVTSSPSDPKPGDTVAFTISQGGVGEVAFTVVGGDVVACEAGDEPATSPLAGVGNGTQAATVCVKRSDTGDASITATSSLPSVTWYRAASESCQVYADYGSSSRADASATFAWPPSVSVGDYVWFDDGDGMQNEDDEAGLNGVTLTLTGPARVTDSETGKIRDVYGNLVNPTTTSDKDGKPGYYLFKDLPVLQQGESYTVTATAPSGYVPTKNGQGDDRGVDSGDAAHALQASSEGLTEDGDQDLTLDFGFVKEPTNPPTSTQPPATTNPPATTEPPTTTTETTDVSGTSSVDATTPTTSIAVEGESSTKTPSTTVEVQGEQQTETDDLASTGVSSSTWMLAVGGALLIGMGALLARTRRSSRAH